MRAGLHIQRRGRHRHATTGAAMAPWSCDTITRSGALSAAASPTTVARSAVPVADPVAVWLPAPAERASVALPCHIVPVGIGQQHAAGWVRVGHAVGQPGGRHDVHHQR